MSDIEDAETAVAAAPVGTLIPHDTTSGRALTAVVPPAATPCGRGGGPCET